MNRFWGSTKPILEIPSERNDCLGTKQALLELTDKLTIQDICNITYHEPLREPNDINTPRDILDINQGRFFRTYHGTKVFRFKLKIIHHKYVYIYMLDVVQYVDILSPVV